MAFRAASCVLRGNKTAIPGASIRDCSCVHCENRNFQREDEEHVIVVCPAYEIYRQIMYSRLRKIWGEWWEIFEKVENTQKKEILLGATDMINGGEGDRRERDLIVKKFLESVNNFRKETLDTADVRGCFNPPPRYYP